MSAECGVVLSTGVFHKKEENLLACIRRGNRAGFEKLRYAVGTSGHETTGQKRPWKHSRMDD